nr:hypothetical protein CFP56_04641 [Quercus suber]
MRDIDLDIIVEILHHRHDPAITQPLDLCRPIDLPRTDIVIRADAQRPTRDHQRPRRVLKRGRHDGFFVLLAAPRLLRRDEARPHPRANRTERQHRGQRSAVVDATGGHHHRRLARQRTGILPRDVDDRGDQDARRDVARVAAAFAALGAHDIHARLQRLVRVLRVSDHVHDEDARGMQALDDMRGWDADSADEERRFLLDRNADQLVELAVGVVVVGLARAAADLWERKIDAEGQRLVREVFFDLMDDGAQLLRRVPESTDHAETPGIGYCSGEGPGRSSGHACEDDRVFDAQDLAEGCLKRWASHDLPWIAEKGRGPRSPGRIVKLIYGINAYLCAIVEPRRIFHLQRLLRTALRLVPIQISHIAGSLIPGVSEHSQLRLMLEGLHKVNEL